MYPPSALLRAGGLDPRVVASRLGLVTVDEVMVRLAPRSMRAAWRGPVAGMALPWGVYVAPEALSGDARRRALLVAHELVHISQWRRLGVTRFLGRYLGDYLRGRRQGLDHHRAYRQISLEQEAEAAVAGLSDLGPASI